MTQSSPPRLSSGPPAGAPAPTSASNRGLDPTYDIIADKVGGVPNLRKQDNLYQAAAIGVFLVIGLIVGWFVAGWPQGVLLGALGGLTAGTLISGAVLTVIGLCRKS